jgi:hypothetical protein
MKVKVTFPLARGNRNWKAVREQLLLDSDGTGGVEDALVRAAEAAKGPGQEVFVSRGYGPAGRLSVWIVDRNEPKNASERKTQREALQAALGRVRL